MSLPDNFVIVDGLLTVEAILQPSWLVRRRINEGSLTGPYVWVATVAQTLPEQFVVKGHLAKDEFSMTPSERRAMKRILTELGFTSGGYERVDEDGASRIFREFTRDGEIAQKID